MSRQIVLDTETTGMNKDGGPTYLGHRIIEIGAVEVINRKRTGNTFHCYLKPDRLIDIEAIQVHGITDEMLKDKPSFDQVYQEFIEFIQDSTLIIHNAPFDLGFLNHELGLLQLSNPLKIESVCQIIDSLKLAREIYPGKRNSLDALCDRLMIDNSKRTKHGALLDADILTDVYLSMTGGQISLFSEEHSMNQTNQAKAIINHKQNIDHVGLITSVLDAEELQAHQQQLALINKKSDGNCLWLKLDEQNSK